MIFLALRAYRTAAKMTMRFTPFQLVYGLKATLPIKCEIPSFMLDIEPLPGTSLEEE